MQLSIALFICKQSEEGKIKTLRLKLKILYI